MSITHHGFRDAFYKFVRTVFNPVHCESIPKETPLLYANLRGQAISGDVVLLPHEPSVKARRETKPMVIDSTPPGGE